MDYRKILEDCGAILDMDQTGEHYKLASGNHSKFYIRKMIALSDPIIASQLAQEIARYIFARDGGEGIEIFLGASTGGAKFANYVGLSYLDILIKGGLYDSDKKILCLEAEKNVVELEEIYGGKRGVEYVVPPLDMKYMWQREEKFFLREEYKKLIKNKKVFTVEDIVTTGGTMGNIIKLIKEAGGIFIGGCCVWDRSGGFKLPNNIPLLSLITEKLESWPANDCLLCKQGKPISEEYGHGGR